MIKLIIAIFLCSNAYSYVSFEIGKTSTDYNFFQIPNSDINRIDLPKEDQIDSGRLNFKLNLGKSKWFIQGIYAPLEVSYSFTSNKSFVFDNTNFSNNTRTKVNYRFNTSRLGFFRKFVGSSTVFWLGGSVLRRDAEIEVIQGLTKKSYDNIGYVPLLGAGALKFFTKKFSLYTHIDGLASSRGSAYDIQVEPRYKLSPVIGIGVGARLLGGGADNDDLLNFAQFKTYYLSIMLGGF